MKKLINMVHFLLNDLAKRPRGRACFIFTHDYKDQKNWAERLSQLTDSTHIDLLEIFQEKSNLSGRLNSFLVSDLFNLLSSYKEKHTLILSGLEFLLASWIGQPKAMEKLAVEIEMWSKKPAILIVMQYDKRLYERKYTRHAHQIIVIDQRETEALG